MAAIGTKRSDGFWRKIPESPDFQIWTKEDRTGLANKWFLERLRSAEPYRSTRWPRPPAAISPPLTLMVPPHDAKAPRTEVHQFKEGREPVEQLRIQVQTWRHNRSVYPGWVVPPLDVSERLWNDVRPAWTRDLMIGLREMGDKERLAALYELNWRMETALIPLSVAFANEIFVVLTALKPDYRHLRQEEEKQYRALALAITRHYREEGDDTSFGLWAERLAPLVRGDEASRLTYEKCLLAAGQLDFATLDKLLSDWSIEGDSFWHVRKAGLLAFAGHSKEADTLSRAALTEIRFRSDKTCDDISSWSREVFATLLRSTFLYGRFEGNENGQLLRDQFDLRHDILESKGCTGRRDLLSLIDQLSKSPPRLRARVEETMLFDLGARNTLYRMDGVDARIDRLRAFQALRVAEEAGLPGSVENASLAAPLMQGAAEWLVGIAPALAIDAFCRATARPKNEEVNAVFSRASVAMLDEKRACRLIDGQLAAVEDVLLRLSACAHGRETFWQDRLKVPIELISRLVLRVTYRASDTMRMAIRLMGIESLAASRALGRQIRTLARRSAEALDENDREPILAELFSMPVPESGSGMEAIDDFAIDMVRKEGGLGVPDL